MERIAVIYLPNSGSNRLEEDANCFKKARAVNYSILFWTPQLNSKWLRKVLILFLNGPIPASFLFIFDLFSLLKTSTISIIQIELSKDGVVEIQTHGHRMVGVDETTKLCRPPFSFFYTKVFPPCWKIQKVNKTRNLNIFWPNPGLAQAA